jgi:hypothetical protein
LPATATFPWKPGGLSCRPEMLGRLSPALIVPPKETSMNDLSAFPITKRWPAAHPDRLQLYSLPTPNGGEIEQDGSRFEKRQRLSAQPIGVEDRGDLAVWIDREEFGRPLVVLAEIDEMRIGRQELAGLLRW